MANESTQSIIQSIAQANPVSANNGNPNTVYNTSMGAWPPVQATGGVRDLAVSPAANSMPLQLNRSEWVAPTTAWEGDLAAAKPVATIPQNWADILSSIAPATQATTTPTTPAPAVTAPTQITVPSGLILGSNKKPARNNELYASDPAYKRAWDEVAAFHKYSPDKAFTRGEDVAKLYDHISTLYKQYAGQTPTAPSTTANTTPAPGVAPSKPPAANATTSEITQGVSKAVDIIGSSGISGAGKVGWNSGSKSTAESAGKLSDAVSNGIAAIQNNTGNIAQFIDAISEPWFPGNLYMSQTGKINAANVAKMLGNMVVPGLGSLAGLIASKIPDSATGVLGQLRDFFMQGKMDEWANLIADNLQTGYQNVTNSAMSNVDRFVENQLNQNIRIPAISGGGEARTGTVSVGSPSAATGIGYTSGGSLGGYSSWGNSFSGGGNSSGGAGSLGNFGNNLDSFIETNAN